MSTIASTRNGWKLADSPVFTRMQQLGCSAEIDHTALYSAMREVREVNPGNDVVKQRDMPGSINFIHRGFACRYTSLPDGRRQITDVFVAGDFFATDKALVRSDYNIVALTSMLVTEVPRLSAVKLLREQPSIADAIYNADLINVARLRELITSLGRRSGKERLAHLFCELFERSRAVGLANGTQYCLPLSQIDCADILGLSLVHVSRSLHTLRASNLVKFRSRLLTIVDLDELQLLAQFDGSYLSLSGRIAERKADETSAAMPALLSRSLNSAAPAFMD